MKSIHSRWFWIFLALGSAFSNFLIFESAIRALIVILVILSMGFFFVKGWK